MIRPIFFLSDFGLADTYVGIVKAAIMRIAPDARIVDLTHEIPPQDVRTGAFALMTATPYLPDDAVVLSVVDPGVGTDRRPIAVQAGGRTFVGPDNGLLSWAIGHEYAAVVLDRSEFWLPKVSTTFHGRDIFGPVAAHLARGRQLDEVGSPTSPVVSFLFPQTMVSRSPDGRIRAAVGVVVHVDGYGNLVTNLRAADLPANPWIDIGQRTLRGIAPNYQTATPSRLLALIGSAGLLEIAVPNGSAASVLGIGLGAPVTATADPPRAAADALAPPS
jgi:S-adenosyl-L-methionine hydrolase (adenosine-forming)